jgi:hypothetical protein
MPPTIGLLINLLGRKHSICVKILAEEYFNDSLSNGSQASKKFEPTDKRNRRHFRGQDSGRTLALNLIE